MVTQFRKYFEEPRSLLLDWRAAQTRTMREAVAAYLPANIKAEHIIHDDVTEQSGLPNNNERRTRRLYNNRLAFSATARLESRLKARQFFLSLAVLVLLLTLSVGVFGGGLTPSLGAVFASYAAGVALSVIGAYLIWLSTGLSSDVYHRLLPRELLLQEDDLIDARDFATRVLLRNNPPETPPDLDDVYRPLNVDADSNPVDGQVVASDYVVSWLRDLLKSNLTVVGVIGFVLVLVGVISLLGAGPLALLSMVPIMVGFTCYLGIRMFVKADAVDRRSIEAKVALSRSPTAKLLERNSGAFKEFERARAAQVKNAIKDDSPVLVVGSSLGVLAERNDPFAPSVAGMPMALSLDGLSRHMCILGKSGSGKTSSLLRKLISFWINSTDGGMLVLDGKGSLPKELYGVASYTLLTPETAIFAPMQNLDPTQLAACMLEIFGSKETRDPIWQQSAHDLILSSASMLAIFVDCEEPGWKWSFFDLHRMMFAPDSVILVKDFFEENTGKASLSMLPARLRLAYEDFTHDFPALAEETRTSIKKNVSSWLAPMLTHPALSTWAEANEGVLIEDVLLGARIGIQLPECPAGAAFSKLAKQRLYNAIKERGDKWQVLPGHKRVLLTVDECHILMTKDKDSEILSIARGLGMCGVFATQDADGLLSTFDNDDSLLQTTIAKMSNLIAFAVNTAASYKLVSERLGESPQVVIQDMPAMHSDAAGLARAMQYNSGGYRNGTIISNEINSAEYADLASPGLTGEVWLILNKLAGKLGLKEAYKMLPSSLSESSKSGTVKIGYQAIIGEKEISSFTVNEFTAFVDIYRCGSQRRDLVQLSPVFAFDKEVA